MNETVSAQSELHYTDLNIAYLCALSINNILKIMTSKNQKKKKKKIIVLQGRGLLASHLSMQAPQVFI